MSAFTRSFLSIVGLWLACLASAAEPLPSWNEGVAKATIISFVKAVTEKGSKDFVPVPERVAVFDNDGTLWVEQPLYTQFVFMLDQVKAGAPEHPKWKDNAAFKALATHDHEALAEMGNKPILELFGIANSGMTVAEYDKMIRDWLAGIANSGMTVAEYDKMIRDWLASARHPKFQRPYTDLVYKPMQELIEYLRANGFKTFIVSGGSVEFMRPWAEKAYGIPAEQIIGTQQEVKFEMRDGKPILTRGPKFVFVNDGPGKPIGVYQHIGRRPIAAFGNSDGDLQLLQITAVGAGRRLMVLVHHDDAEREFAYDRQSHVGKLDKAWDAAQANGWIVVSMKSDWKRVFPFEK